MKRKDRGRRAVSIAECQMAIAASHAVRENKPDLQL
jgi:hypothetical protein